MMQKLTRMLDRITSRLAVLVSLLVFLFFMAWVLPQMAASTVSDAGTGRSPDLSLYYTSKDLYRMAADYGEMGRRAYIKVRFTFDLAYPLVYAAFLALTTSYLLKGVFPTASAWRSLNLLPLGAALFDFLENLAASLVMARFPDPTPGVDAIAGVFTLTKWILIAGSFLALAVSLAAVLLHQVAGKKAKNPEDTGDQ